jgi:EAL domain-containing protein (putative c-di-GMP-specific phosphodiesterase class I)
MGAIVNFGDLLSITDPVVSAVVENTVTAQLGRIPHRQFRLTPRVLVVLFDSQYAKSVTDALSRIERDLSIAHCGHLEWKAQDLRRDMAHFRAACRAVLDNEQLHPSQTSYRAANDQLGALLHIIDALHTVDLGFHVRKQPVVRMAENKRPALEFEEWTVSLDELERAIGLPIRDEQWKFQHVTEFLDFKVLDQVIEAWSGDRSVAVNFHVRNILLPRFDEMVRRITPEWRPHLIFELSVAEFLSDQVQYVKAAAKLRDHGFRVAADTVVWPFMESVAGVFPSVQYVKMPWTDAFERSDAAQRTKINALIAGTPALTFVLCRCGTKENLKVGQQLGFRVFEGWGVPAPQAAAANPPPVAANPVVAEKKPAAPDKKRRPAKG